MRKGLLFRLGIALWLGIITLAANAFEQQQFSANVITVQLAGLGNRHTGFHVMPDGTVMAGDMSADTRPSLGENQAPDAGGHTHKGHLDCHVCGTIAAMAAFTLPILAVAPLSPAIFAFVPHARYTAPLQAAYYTPYSSRAPPVSTILRT